ncbi:unnamed protein product [Merluccius merluccius]
MHAGGGWPSSPMVLQTPLVSSHPQTPQVSSHPQTNLVSSHPQTPSGRQADCSFLPGVPVRRNSCCGSAHDHTEPAEPGQPFTTRDPVSVHGDLDPPPPHKKGQQVLL